MKTVIFFYTGTGNSLWSARLLQEELGNADIIPLIKYKGSHIDADAIGLFFPVHIWGVPGRVIEFVESLPSDRSKYYFAAAVNAGQVAATLKQLKRIMTLKGIKLSSGFDICLPSNYIPWGGPGPENRQMKRFNSTKEKIKKIAAIVKERQDVGIEKGPLWQNIIFTLLYKMSFKKVSKLDKYFWVDERCNDCHICRKICPANNISIEDAKPKWGGDCQQCLACIQWCPVQAIQYGERTPKYKRYHHPEVRLKDIIDIAKH